MTSQSVGLWAKAVADVSDGKREGFYDVAEAFIESKNGSLATKFRRREATEGGKSKIGANSR
jgi:hypothetical protein